MKVLMNLAYAFDFKNETVPQSDIFKAVAKFAEYKFRSSNGLYDSDSKFFS